MPIKSNHHQTTDVHNKVVSCASSVVFMCKVLPIVSQWECTREGEREEEKLKKLKIKGVNEVLNASLTLMVKLKCKTSGCAYRRSISIIIKRARRLYIASLEITAHTFLIATLCFYRDDDGKRKFKTKKRKKQ